MIKVSRGPSTQNGAWVKLTVPMRSRDFKLLAKGAATKG